MHTHTRARARTLSHTHTHTRYARAHMHIHRHSIEQMTYFRPTLVTYRKFTDTQAWHSWSEWGESVRKAIEHVIGRLKGRFRILKPPLLFQDIQEIGHLVHTCCVRAQCPATLFPILPPFAHPLFR
jgi:hypothetical protein